MSACFECGEPAAHDHHVVPRSRGGKNTVPLCAKHHGMAHGLEIRHENLTKRVMQHMRAQGLRVGSIPHGYALADDGKTLVENEREQVAIRLIKSMRAEGRTLQSISDELAARGMLNKAGRPFNVQTIRKISMRDT